MNKSESKYFNTAVKMDKAFLELLEKKDFEFITVKEICEKAVVNRSTFYLHYETIGDLLDESIQYIFDKFLSVYPYVSARFIHSIKNADLKELYLITPKYFKPYLLFISDNKSLFTTALLNANSLGLEQHYNKMFTHVLSPILDRFNVPENRRKYMLAFYVRGIIAIIDEWLKGECFESIDFIIDIIASQIPKMKEDI